jgi:hypothetical protein
MKRIPALITVLLVAQCLTGCFSTAYRMNSGMSAGTGGGNGAGAVAAGALDVVTLPLQAPVLATVAAKKANQKPVPMTLSMQPPTKDLLEIRKNPQYLFQHRSTLHRDVIQRAIRESDIPFTEAQLRMLGEPNEWTRPYVSANARCPQDLLEEIWTGMGKLPVSERQTTALFLIENPNIPDTWLEKVANQPELYGYASAKARLIINVRKRAVQTPAKPANQ